MPTFNFSNAPLATPIVNDTIPDADQVMQHLNDLKTFLNTTKLGGDNIQDASIGSAHPTAALAALIGINSASAVARGKSIIATEESRTNAAAGTLTTPDQVSNVVVPTDGLLAVQYEALWKESVIGCSLAGIYLGANQLKTRKADGGSDVQAAGPLTGGVNQYRRLFTMPIGLVGQDTGTETEVGPATGYALGVWASGSGELRFKIGATAYSTAPIGIYPPLCIIKVPAGTYTVSVQFATGAGTTTVKNRELRVWTMSTA